MPASCGVRRLAAALPTPQLPQSPCRTTVILRLSDKDSRRISPVHSSRGAASVAVLSSAWQLTFPLLLRALCVLCVSLFSFSSTFNSQLATICTPHQSSLSRPPHQKPNQTSYASARQSLRTVFPVPTPPPAA